MGRKSTVDGSPPTIMANFNLSIYHFCCWISGAKGGVLQSIIQIITFAKKSEAGESAGIHLSYLFFLFLMDGIRDV